MISLNKNTISNLLVGSMISAGLVGSWLYVYNSAFAIGTIIMFAIGPFVAINFMTRTHIKIDIFLFYVLAGLFVLSCIALIYSRTPDNLRYCKSFLYALFAFAFIDYICVFHRGSVWLGCALFMVVIGVVAIPQVTYILFGFGVNPAYTGDAGDLLTASAFRTASVRSIFYNPNNFASACTLLLILSLQAKDGNFMQHVLVKMVLLSLIILAGSRACLLVSIVAILFHYLSDLRSLKKRSISKLITLSASGLVIILVASRWLSKSHILEKLSTVTNILGSALSTGATHVTDVSVRERWSAYAGFFNRFFSLGMGSFEAKNYLNIYKQGTLISENPHSLVLELSALYGYFGLLAFIFLLTWLYFSVRGRVGSRLGAASVCLGVFIISCVPSSVINFATFWIFFYLIGRYSSSEPGLERDKRVSSPNRSVAAC